MIEQTFVIFHYPTISQCQYFEVKQGITKTNYIYLKTSDCLNMVMNIISVHFVRQKFSVQLPSRHCSRLIIVRKTQQFFTLIMLSNAK